MKLVTLNNTKVLKDIDTGKTYIQCGCGGDLKELGGGGDCDWNLMKNKPFYEYRENLTIFEGDIEFSANEPVELDIDSEEILFPLFLNGIDPFTHIYTVLWDGEVFECQANDGTIGNLSLIEPSETDTGEPFVIDGFNMVMTPNAGRHSLSISTSFNAIQRLDEKFLPFGIVLRDPETGKIPDDALPRSRSIVRFSKKADGSYGCGYTYDHVIDMLNAGQNVIAEVASNNAYSYCLPFTTRGAGQLVFSGYVAGDTGIYTTVHLIFTRSNEVFVHFGWNDELVLVSESGKKFKITVSDDGTLSATAVTS